VTVRGNTRLVIDSAQSDFATVLAVYEPRAFSPPGAADAVDCVAATAAGGARLAFDAQANVTYLLQAGGRDGSTGILGFTISCEPSPCPPRNDSIVSPWYFDRPYGDPYQELFDLRGATVERGEPLDCGNMAHTAWWVLDMYEGRSPIPFLFDTAGSTMPAAIAVYEAPLVYSPDGSLGASFDALRRLRCDVAEGGAGAVSRFTAVSGTRYYVQVGGRDGATGDLAVMVSCDGGCPPDNDNVQQAWYPPFGFEQLIDTRAATLSPGEPQPCGNIGKTIWYRMDGPAAGEYRVTTAGSDYRTAIAVYRTEGWSPPDGLVSLGCSTSGAMTVSAESGSVYYIQVGGIDGAGGALMTRVDCVEGCAATSPPGGIGVLSAGGSLVGPDTGSGGYLPRARR
jgi:hypothetical protein